MTTLNQLFVNKLMPDFDYGAVVCWAENIYNRTHFPSLYSNYHKLDDKYYSMLPHVRYNRRKHKHDLKNKNDFKINHFANECIHPYQDYNF